MEVDEEDLYTLKINFKGKKTVGKAIKRINVKKFKREVYNGCKFVLKYRSPYYIFFVSFFGSGENVHKINIRTNSYLIWRREL